VTLVFAKVLISPLLLAGATFAVQKWGALVGGLMLGLPLVSGPMSVFLFAQYGPRFAANAAYGTLLGFVAAGAFCITYALVSSRRSWWQSLILALAAFLATAILMSFVHLSLMWVIGLVALALAVLAFVIQAPEDLVSAPRPRKRILAVRMVIAASVVLLVTTSARFLGAEAAGFLAPLPVLAGIMATSSHRRQGTDAVHGLLRGTVFGSWGGAAFFSVVILLVGTSGPVFTYAAALTAALVAGSLAVLVQNAMRSGGFSRWHLPAWRNHGLFVAR